MLAAERKLGRCLPNTPPETQKPARGSPWGHPKSLAGEGKARNFGGQRKAASIGKQCVPSRKQKKKKAAHANAAACGSLFRAGGAGAGRSLPRLAGW